MGRFQSSFGLVCVCVRERDVEATLVISGHIYVVFWSVCLNQKLELMKSFSSSLPASGKMSNINCVELAVPDSHAPVSAEKVKSRSGKIREEE